MLPLPTINEIFCTIPCFAPPHLPPLSKVRCCRPKKFVRLPEGLSLHQPFQNRTIPLAFRNANICMHQYVFTSALSHENRQHPCLLMNALLVSHPCETLGVQLRASMPALEKRGEVLLHGQAAPTMVVIAPPPTINEIFCTIPSHFAMLTSVCADTLSHPHYPLPRTMSLPPLSKVRCCRPKKFGRLPEGLSLHQPFQNRTIPLAFRRARACVCLVGFASIAIVVVCGRCVTASSAISVAASCSDSHLCRCIVQRLSVTDFMHPCIPTFCDHL